MPTTPRPKPRVDPALLRPIEGLPDKMNQMLLGIAASNRGEIQPIAALLETSTTQVQRWRDKNPEFDQRIIDIQAEVDVLRKSRLKQRFDDVVENGIRKYEIAHNGDGEVIHERESFTDSYPAIEKAMEVEFPEVYGRNVQPELDSGPTQFIFRPEGGRALEAGPEAAEIIAEDPPDDE